MSSLFHRNLAILLKTLHILLILLWAAPSYPEDAESNKDEEKTDTKHTQNNVWVRDEMGAKVQPYFVLQHHGYFRFRSDLFYRADLGTKGSSGFKSPLTENLSNSIFKRNATTQAGANMRFRYEPVFLIGERLKISGQFDVLDNIVLGSTPSFHPGQSLTPLTFFTTAQESPESGKMSFKDAIQVKRIWGDWQILAVFNFAFGRMPHHWGMGMLFNDGGCMDCDFGDSIDSLRIRATFFQINFAASWDYFGEGALSSQGGDFFGQPYDLDQLDDFHQWTFAIFQKPLTVDEIRKRSSDLKKGKWALDWGFYSVFRLQPLSSEKQPMMTESCRTTDSNSIGLVYDCIQLADRDAFLWIPDAWLRFEWWPKPNQQLLLEMELASIYGTITTTQALANTDTSKKLIQFGGVFRGSYKLDHMHFRFELGFATGDSSDYFGILDGQNIAVPNDSDYATNPVVSTNKRLMNMKFNRDYQIDLLLFREIIGAVTNTVYLRPSFSYDILTTGKHAFSGEAVVLFARAIEKGATPGNSYNLGFEMDLHLRYAFGSSFFSGVSLGVLVPFAAFKNRDLGLSPKVATTLQAYCLWKF